jgi:hypothetical protein
VLSDLKKATLFMNLEVWEMLWNYLGTSIKEQGKTKDGYNFN